MRVFKDVDILSALRKIVDNNNLYYKSDYEYDVEALKKAAEGSRFLWMSRSSGTYLFDERDAHIRNTYAHITWQYYTDAKYYGVKAFAVAVMGNDGGKPVGDIYELHYNKHMEEVRKNSFNAKTVDVTFKATHIYPETTRWLDVAEYNDLGSTLIRRYGEIESVRYNLSAEDDSRLAKILAGSRQRRDEEAVPASVAGYVRDMVKERFHEYGYTRDDMAFTTPEDAVAALRHLIPVYILHPDNTAEQAKTTVAVDNAVYDGLMFGMNERDKRLLNFYKAGNTLADLPFTHAELSAIFHMALDRGKENIEDEQQRKAVDGIIGALDTMLFSDDGRDAEQLEFDNELEEGFEQ